MGSRILDVNGAVTAHGQCLFDSLNHPVRADGEGGHLGSITQLLFEADRLLDGVFVIFVHAEGQVGLGEPDTCCVGFKAGFQVWNLFDADKNFHNLTPFSETTMETGRFREN